MNGILMLIAKQPPNVNSELKDTEDHATSIHAGR